MSVRAAFALALLVLGPSAVRADVDLTGRWLIHYHIAAVLFDGYECQNLTQIGTTLRWTECQLPPTDRGSGTIDPVSGQFDLPSWTNGLAAPDSNTYTASSSVTVCHPPFVCESFPVAIDGARCNVVVENAVCGGNECGDGQVEPGEECDAGSAANGTPASCCTLDCRFRPAGASCDLDADVSTPDTCDASGNCLAPLVCGPCTAADVPSRTCVPDVRADCRHPVSPAGRTTLSSGSVAWTWERGAPTALADFGDPLTSTDYRLCVFADDGAGGTTVVAARDVAHGGTCGARACWRQSGATTYRYSNARTDGFRSVQLRSGADGAAKVTVKASGPSLAMPASLAAVHAPLTVQLERLDDTACWASRFPTARSTSAVRFSARNGD